MGPLTLPVCTCECIAIIALALLCPNSETPFACVPVLLALTPGFCRRTKIETPDTCLRVYIYIKLYACVFIHTETYGALFVLCRNVGKRLPILCACVDERKPIPWKNTNRQGTTKMQTKRRYVSECPHIIKCIFIFKTNLRWYG